MSTLLNCLRMPLRVRIALPALLGAFLVLAAAGAKADTAMVLLENRSSQAIHIKLIGNGVSGRYSIDVLRPGQRKFYTTESYGSRRGMALEQSGGDSDAAWLTRALLYHGRRYVIDSPGRVRDAGVAPLPPRR